MMEKSYQQQLNRKNKISASCPANAEIFSSLSSRSTLNTSTTNTRRQLSNTNCSRILSGLALPLKLLLISSCMGIVDVVQSLAPPDSVGFPSVELQCIMYNYREFTIVNRICVDCYNLFREPKIYRLCRQECFLSLDYENCLNVLLIPDEKRKQMEQHILHLNGANFLEEELNEKREKKTSESHKIDAPTKNIWGSFQKFPLILAPISGLFQMFRESLVKERH